MYQPNTLLARTWKSLSWSAILVNITFQLMFRCIQIYSSNPICTSDDYSTWIDETRKIEIVSFCVVTLVVFGRAYCSGKLFSRNLDISSNSGTAATVCILAGSSSILTFFWNWGGICEDAFGVRIPASRLSEWLTSVPLLIYSVIAVEKKNSLRKSEKITLIAITLAMLCFLFMHLNISYALSIFFLSLACISFGICTYLFIISANIHIKNQYILLLDDDNLMDGGQANIRYKLTLWLLITMPLFPIVYFLSLFNAINNDVAEFLFIICNLTSKLFLNIISLDIHIGILYQSLLVQHAASNETRRAFLRYIMHEVRVPLSSITMGLDYISSEEYNNNSNSNNNNNSNNNISNNNNYNNYNHGANMRFEIRDTIAMMRDASFCMGDTLDNVLAIQKIEEGMFEIVKIPFDLRSLVNRAIQSIEDNIEKRNVKIDLKLSDHIPNYIIGDCIRIENALKVLLHNAITYSPKNTPVILTISMISVFGDRIVSKKIFSRMTDNNNIVIVFNVQDFGPGISEQQLKQLFKPFVHLRQGTNMTHNKSSGVSLFVSKQIIERHGGSLECMSEEGKGSTFRITVPVTIASKRQVTDINVRKKSIDMKVPIPYINRSLKLSTNQTSGIMEMESVSNAGDRNGNDDDSDDDNDNEHNNEHNNNNVEEFKKPEAIHEMYQIGLRYSLVVDDMMSCRKLLGYLLKRENIKSDEASDGVEAVQAVRRNISRYQVIFMDNTMPNMTGVEATEQIRALGYSNLIVGVTGNAMEDDVKTFLRAGADMIFTKPLKLEHLHALILHTNINGCESDPRSKYRLNGNAMEHMPT